jgi:hypothetical protein
MMLMKVRHHAQANPSNPLGYWTRKYHSAGYDEREPHEFLFAENVSGRHAVQAHP